MPGPVYYDLYDCGELVGRYSGAEIWAAEWDEARQRILRARR